MFRPCWEALQSLCWQDSVLAADWELLATVWPLTHTHPRHFVLTNNAFHVEWCFFTGEVGEEQLGTSTGFQSTLSSLVSVLTLKWAFTKPHQLCFYRTHVSSVSKSQIISTACSTIQRQQINVDILCAIHSVREAQWPKTPVLCSSLGTLVQKVQGLFGNLIKRNTSATIRIYKWQKRNMKTEINSVWCYNVWLSCSDPRCGWTDHHRCPDKADIRTKEGDCFCLWKESKEGRVHPDGRLSQFPHRSKETVKGTHLCFQDMISALKGVLSGSLESVILGLMKSTTQYDASEIRGAIKVKEIGC